jgi:AcrR family transcriptional regulator
MQYGLPGEASLLAGEVGLMPQLDGRSLPARRRGRPVGSDSAETRSTILRAARQVINERGYHAATFQTIAMAAGLSRPTLHYYFSSREEIYGVLVADASGVIADCIGEAKREETFLEQLAALIAAMLEADVRDRSLIAFLVSARLEATRNPELEVGLGNALRNFLRWSLSAAKSRGELAADTAVVPIADMLHAMLWGLGFHAGFIDSRADLRSIAGQFNGLFSKGLLGPESVATGHREALQSATAAP